ncbi:MAG: bifunctional nicotinamidase/pyrazinamidase [Legionellaceae bacterium]|nr:bifunctional nicotinamidase/pyrazinamidase [Legionellaceae bacterium]
MKALLIIDAQNDFMPGGTLPVPYGDKIIEPINKLQYEFELIVATQDWHPINHESFASNHINTNPFDKKIINGFEQTVWPNHCVQGTKGAMLHSKLNTNLIAAIFRKGMNPKLDSYSSFYDNNHMQSTGLKSYLKERNIKEIFFCGLCADICVYYSILDAVDAGFSCNLLEEATRPLDKDNMSAIKQHLLKIGVKILGSVDN